jgi:hypothetical protein
MKNDYFFVARERYSQTTLDDPSLKPFVLTPHVTMFCPKNYLCCCLYLTINDFNEYEFGIKRKTFTDILFINSKMGLSAMVNFVHSRSS